MLQMEFNNPGVGERRKSQAGLHRGVTTTELELGLNARQLAGGDGAEAKPMNADDMFEEFLLDEDMANLESICAKWKGLEGFDVDGFAKVCPEIAKDLQEADEHVKEFLNLCRSLIEKQARKENIKKETQRKINRLEALRLGKDVDSDEDDSEDQSSEPSSPSSPIGRRKFSASHQSSPSGSPRLQRMKSFGNSRSSASSKSDEQEIGGDGLPMAVRRRFSVAPSRPVAPSKFSQAGSLIAGQKPEAEETRSRLGVQGSRASVLQTLGLGAGSESSKHGQQGVLLFEKRMERMSEKARNQP